MKASGPRRWPYRDRLQYRRAKHAPGRSQQKKRTLRRCGGRSRKLGDARFAERDAQIARHQPRGVPRRYADQAPQQLAQPSSRRTAALELDPQSILTPQAPIATVQKLRSDVHFQGSGAQISYPRAASRVALSTMWSCKAGDGTAGRRLTCSDARVGYRLSDFRPGLVPVLQRASARKPAAKRSTGVPHRGPASSLAQRLWLFVLRCWSSTVTL